ncbi:YbhB/YbcL family Raf kinase inhibitor-like protein [Pseudohoeflea coraliihabitans]|uniref:YbhB/YbcL family Raf kinase inhibitor-like protein n=1 Tax=Pseudohoeflea coraliihabitans TaxID=2860393 RepID=A0ABS6WSN4_9HYPH|nr:YbhB/YbcL family Raf kinase inhibitor-like protein [Pseudohoeflea sp. DP4N28-3]MBW3098950.1 YbhB/YbcL family Raf kinase inhibitor-like protein [Pseudohoeflea sp. DP4N28-3]
MSSVAAELVDVRKTFGPTVALDRVNLRAYEAEVHAIIGGNGSGKSTLAKVISGVLVPDHGQVSIFGKSATTPSESKELGIANVYQEVLVADECSVLDNLFLGADGLFGAAEPHDVRYERARQIMADLLGFELDPDTIVGELPLSIKQWITIARGMLTNPRVLILDESSAALDFEATERLFRKIREMKADGCAIFIVTHRIAELVRIADRATVLRDGLSVGTLEQQEITEENILHLIAGPERERAQTGQTAVKRLSDQPVLRMNSINVWPDTPRFDFNLYPGEVVGVTGLDGQGQADFVRAIAGVEPPLSGTIHIIRDKVAEPVFDLASARENGIAYVSGDRKKEGIFPNLSIFENMSMSIYPEHATGGFFNFIDRRKLDPIFAHETGKLATKMGDPGNLITSLSGGNQQKVLIARSFAERPGVLVLNDPARGIDIGAKLDLYRNLREYAGRGNAAVFLSSEIEEFLDLCNRVLVFRGGVISSTFEPPFDTHVILNATFGRKADARLPGEERDEEADGANWRSTGDDGRPAARPVRLGPTINGRIRMNQSGFLLMAPDIPQGSIIPDRFTERNQTSPALEWEGVPDGTQSFALAITDPDLPEEFNFPRSFAHWLVYNIPADVRFLPEGASMTGRMPSGSQELNSDFVTFGIPGFGRGYGGPWPPDAAHRYVFTLYALKARSLELPPEADLTAFAKAVLPLTIDQSSFTATYGPAKAALPTA